MPSKRKDEDRRFQIELAKTQVDLGNLMTFILGTIALEFSIFWYYGEIGEVLYQFIVGALMLLTIYIVFPTVYLRKRNTSFKSLEEKFITTKEKEKEK